jgi:hypothetical protein
VLFTLLFFFPCHSLCYELVQLVPEAAVTPRLFEFSFHEDVCQAIAHPAASWLPPYSHPGPTTLTRVIGTFLHRLAHSLSTSCCLSLPLFVFSLFVQEAAGPQGAFTLAAHSPTATPSSPLLQLSAGARFRPKSRLPFAGSLAEDPYSMSAEL